MQLRSSILHPRSSARAGRYPLSSILSPLPRPSFTIVELMISIALVVILMVGIHQVFKMSSDTVGIGNTIGAMSQSNRSVQQVFHDDYQRLVKNAPLLILHSGVSCDPSLAQYGAFTSDAERSADPDGDPLTQDLNGDGKEGDPAVNGELTPLSIYNSRNHRVDIVGFPANGVFHRHTANDGSYSSPVTAQDAFIFYEHVKQPTYSAGKNPPQWYYDPGDPDPANRNNYLAGQWILGRVALLMRDVITGPDIAILRNSPMGGATSTGVPDLSPLSYPSLSGDLKFPLHQSRYDLLAASLETLRQDVADVRNAGTNQPPDGIASTWWQPLIYQMNAPGSPGLPGNKVVGLPARFQCNPRVNKPITSEGMAKAMPVLLNNCSQFIVEYAGDFVTQYNTQFDTSGNADPNWGEVTDDQPDGVIDYVVDHTNITNAIYTVAARVRWYGLPRDTTGDRFIASYANPVSPSGRAKYNTGASYGGPAHNNELLDVVPLQDVMRTARSLNQPLNPGLAIYPNHLGAAFEREMPLGDYNNPPKNGSFRYTCVWANSAPTMLRIALKLEDPAGRLPDGQWYEYVVGAP